MIELNVPGRDTLKIYLVCDVNGTMALDGKLLEGVARGFKTLRDRLEIHLLSADTFGTLMQINHQLEVHAHIIPPGDETAEKAEFVRRLGAEHVIAIGQGANDRGMLQTAALGICILSREGAATETLLSADVIVPDIVAALELLEKPLRMIATLRKSDLPTSEPIPSQPESNSSTVRRRRYHRASAPQTDDEHSTWLEALTRQLTPSFDFFLASLLSALVLAIALLLNSDALLILGVLFAPFLGPVIGIAFGSTNGTARLLFISILSLAAAGLFIFGFGALAGALMPMLPLTLRPDFTNWTAYEWPNFAVLAVGVGLSVYMLIRSPRQRPLVANIAIAYGLFPPLTAAGFNLVVYPDGAWIAGITVAGVHLAFAVLVGIVMLILLGYPPRNLGGFLMTGLLIGILVAAFMTSGGVKGPVGAMVPTAPPAVMPPISSPTATLTLTVTPQPTISHSATATFTPTITFEPTGTSTETITPQPTPVWARITAPTGGGALLRHEPDGKIISSILNGGMVQVISDPVRGKTTTIWVQVRTENGLIGWIVQSLLATATPAPGW